MINLNKELSHNVYSDENEPTLTKLCNYLIKIEQSEDFEEIIPCNSITKAIEICANEKRICRLYERSGSVGKNWHYLVDVSRGVL